MPRRVRASSYASVLPLRLLISITISEALSLLVPFSSSFTVKLSSFSSSSIRSATTAASYSSFPNSESSSAKALFSATFLVEESASGLSAVFASALPASSASSSGTSSGLVIMISSVFLPSPDPSSYMPASPAPKLSFTLSS